MLTLTSLEKAVVELRHKGLTWRSIADELFYSEERIYQIRRILKKKGFFTNKEFANGK